MSVRFRPTRENRVGIGTRTLIENRESWLAILLKVEGGATDDRHDPGGPTSAGGVTQATLAAWRGRPVTREEVAALTLEEVKQVAIGLYWSVVSADAMPGGVDLVLSDTAYNSGPSTAVRILQELVGTKVDGFCGPDTIAATRAVPDTANLIRAYSTSRISYLQTLGERWTRYGKGWRSRVEQVEAIALSLVRSNTVEAGLPRSKILWGSLAGFLASLAALAPAIPEIVGAGQRAHQAASTGDLLQVVLGLAGCAGTVIAVLSRLHIWRTGRLTIAAPAAVGAKA